MPPRFHVVPALSPSLVGTSVGLPSEVAHHATRVLRLAAGSSLTLFDGTGGEYVATLVEVGKRDAIARLERFDDVERESPLQVTLVQSVLATDAMDYAIRKAVELGASAVLPVAAARSQVSLAGERGDKRVAHWRGIAIAACEQCGRNRIPPIAAPQSFRECLASMPQGTACAIAAPGAAGSLADLAACRPPLAIMIGPEGGFTDAELAHARERKVLAVHLGPRVLRAETAGVAALAMLAALVGDAR